MCKRRRRASCCAGMCMGANAIAPSHLLFLFIFFFLGGGGLGLISGLNPIPFLVPQDPLQDAGHHDIHRPMAIQSWPLDLCHVHVLLSTRILETSYLWISLTFGI